ncbi:DNA replication protein [Geomicrobium sp. JCM 19037]|uniref:DNA replication protein n=1 Tax=Geomicrobium sp. JCM 19037 TaxID=1460634 RepID=UPI001EE64A15|nr:DNA replication protein [Geomicrobium sp. JCM 19037]
MHSAAGRHTNANLPPEYARTMLSNAPPASDQAQQYADLRRYVDTFSGSAGEIRSVYLYSASPGTGKTTTAAALINEWLAARYLVARSNNENLPKQLAYFLDVNEWQSQYLQFNRSHIPEDIAQGAALAYYRSMEKAKHAPFAVLDDIGVRGVTEAFRADLHGIINARVVTQLPTVYTSNIAMDELADVFGEARLADRVRMNTLQIPFGGESKRGVKAK